MLRSATALLHTKRKNFLPVLIRDHELTLHYVIANEAGASVYSASKLAKDELPDLDVSLRGAVSIARRVQDPLAELVKIEPKAIGVGQYQHDVDQKELLQALDGVVESAVNHVGVDLNTASVELLRHVAGIQGPVAKNIVAWRDANGRFSRRKELLKIPRLGPAAFVQCAGFLRVADATDPLDNTRILNPMRWPKHCWSVSDSRRPIFAPAKKLSQPRRRPSNSSMQQPWQQSWAQVRTDAARYPVRLGQAGPRPARRPAAAGDLKNIVGLDDLLPGAIVKGTVHNVTDAALLSISA